MTTTPKNRREELNALMTSMRDEETAAMQEAYQLFISADMDAFMTKMTEFRDRTLPGSHFDQIFSSTINVLESTKTMLVQTYQTVLTPSQDQESAAQVGEQAA